MPHHVQMGETLGEWHLPHCQKRRSAITVTELKEAGITAHVDVEELQESRSSPTYR